jgi:glycosyltransferase involved in cell wall biosynthesis
MSGPLVSIVLPTYNGSRHLADSVESCLAQIYQNWELVIVDDASDDDTPAIIEEYAARDARIRFVRHHENRMLPAALNTGFGTAQGEFLSWTSDDNCYRPQALHTMVSFLMENTDVDVVYASFSMIDSEDRLLGRQSARPANRLSYQSCVGPCFLFRRRVMESLKGYDEQCFLVEDYEFWLRAKDQFRFEPVQDDLYLYRAHEQGLSREKQAEVRLATIHLLKRHISESDWSRADQSLAHLRITRETAALGQKSDARSHLIRAIMLWPPSVWKREILPAMFNIFVGAKGFEDVKTLYHKAQSIFFDRKKHSI